MTKIDQKELIVALREEGLSYREISEKVGCSPEYARNIYSRSPKKAVKNTATGTCLFCGKPLINTKGAKPKKFCNKKCCANYYNQRNKRKPYIRRCEYCHNEFVSYGYPKKRFCSRECQTLAARGGKHGEEAV